MNTVLFLVSMILVLGFAAPFVFLMALIGPPESFPTEYFIETAYTAIVMFMLILILSGVYVFASVPASL